MSSSKVFDFVGNEIATGDTVVYPVRRGSKMWLQKLTITQVTSGADPKLSGFNTEGRRVTVHNLSNVIKVKVKV